MDDPNAEVEIKSQLKSRGSGTKEKDLKPYQQLYNLQIKPTQSTRQTLCLWNIYIKTLRAPMSFFQFLLENTKENALVLIAVDIGGKNTQE